MIRIINITADCTGFANLESVKSARSVVDQGGGAEAQSGELILRASAWVLLFREAEFHAGHKIQTQGRIPEDLFIFLIQDVIQSPIDLDSMQNPV